MDALLALDDHPALGRIGKVTRNGRWIGASVYLAFIGDEEPVARVPWLRRTAVPRIAWITRDLADAGWTCDLVMDWLAGGDAPTRRARPAVPRRPGPTTATRNPCALPPLPGLPSPLSRTRRPSRIPAGRRTRLISYVRIWPEPSHMEQPALSYFRDPYVS